MDTNIEKITYGNIIVTKNETLITAGTSANRIPTGAGPVTIFARHKYESQEHADKVFKTCMRVIQKNKAADGTGMASYYNYQNHHPVVKAHLSNILG